MTLELAVEGQQEVVIYDPIFVVPAVLVFHGYQSAVNTTDTNLRYGLRIKTTELGL